MRSVITSSKKGQLNLLVPGILTLVVGASLLIAGLIVLEKVKGTTSTQSNSIVNETLTTVTETGERVATNNTCGFTSFVVSVVTNATSGTVIPSTNYSALSNGVVKFTAPTGAPNGINNTNWNVSYTYKYGDISCQQANKSIIGLGSFANFWEIIVLAIVITLVLALLMGLMMSKSRIR